MRAKLLDVRINCTVVGKLCDSLQHTLSCCTPGQQLQWRTARVRGQCTAQHSEDGQQSVWRAVSRRHLLHALPDHIGLDQQQVSTQLSCFSRELV